MKKIAYLVPVFPVASETFITTEIKAMQRQGNSVQLICLERSDEPCLYGDDDILKNSLCVAEVSKKQAFMMVFSLFFRWFSQPGMVFVRLLLVVKALWFILRQKGVRPRSLLLQSLKICCLLERIEAEHVRAHFGWAPASNGIVAARLFSVPVSLTCHGSDVYNTPQDLQLKLQNADLVIAVCKRMLHDFKQLVPTANVKHIPCGVDMQQFRPDENSHDIPVALTFLFIGRLSETKGVDYLLDALAMIPQAMRPMLHIAGDGPMTAQLMAQCQALNLQQDVVFLGRVDRVWLIDHLAGYDATVLPFCKTSTGIMDTGPLTLKEAMACRVPVLTTDIMATGEILDTFSAWICRHNDAEDLSLSLLDLVEHLNAGKHSVRHASLELRIDRAFRLVSERFDADRLAGTLTAALFAGHGSQAKRSGVVTQPISKAGIKSMAGE